MIFGRSIPKATGHQMAIQFPHLTQHLFYTTWGKQNKRNMHWNEQQTSTNWRLDGKLNSHLMASCFRNICAKNL